MIAIYREATVNKAPVLSERAIQSIVRSLGSRISNDYQYRSDAHLTIVSVLKGALIFTADLLRAMTFTPNIVFVQAKSYVGRERYEKVALQSLGFHPQDIASKHVMIVDTMLDSGHTLVTIKDMLQIYHPASIEMCVLLDKGKSPLNPKYVGQTVGDKFLIGYGLDINNDKRGLKDIWIGE